MGSGWNVPGNAHQGHISHSPQCYQTLAVLLRFVGVGVFQNPFRPRDGSKMLLHQGQRLGFIQLARDDDHRIVRLIVLAIERLQILNRHPFDIATIANRRLAVIVPLIGRRHDPLAEHAFRAVFPPFKFVANHGHLGKQVFPQHAAVHQAVGFQGNGEF